MEDFSLQIYDSVASTMDVARESLRSCSAVTKWRCILTYDQTAGRGQRGRTWFALPGQSFCATFLYRSREMTPSRAGSFALLAGVAVVEALKRSLSGSSQPYDIGLKWPNDVLLNGKKLGGILVEMVQEAEGGWVVLIGVGINLTIPAFPAEVAPFATSLLCESLPSPTPEEFAHTLYATLKAQVLRLKNEGLGGLVEQWRDFDRTTGRRFSFEEAGVALQGVATGISEEGMLCLHLETGKSVVVQTASSLKEMIT